MRELHDYINASIRPLHQTVNELDGSDEDGSKTCPARSSITNHRKSFSVACAYEQATGKVSLAEAAYGNCEGQ